jgi:alkanesulfonate monooxygenase SsuD/methylene tetrahydromethanopterin reductase-like flavin-dependent oxidoreductase (luciferase family)
MKIGQFLLVSTPDPEDSFVKRYDETFELIDLVNGTAFRSLWFAEHHFSNYGYSPNPLILMAKAAEVAPQARLGTAIAVLPLWHPIRLAEDIATVDVLSGGRVELGVGRGYLPFEFEGLGVDVAKNREMFDEALSILLAALSQDDFEYSGAFWDIPRLTVYPKPIQQPRPPIWMAATSPASIRSAVASGYHLATGTGALPDELKQRSAYIDACARQSGRSAEALESAVNRFVFCSENPDACRIAIEEAQRQVRISQALSSGGYPVQGRIEGRKQDGELPPELWQERMIIGDPEQCLRRIRDLAGAGLSYIFGLFHFGGLPHQMAVESLRLFISDVLPKLESIETVHITGEDLLQEAEAFVEGGPGYIGF